MIGRRGLWRREGRWLCWAVKRKGRGGGWVDKGNEGGGRRERRGRR